MRQRLEAYLQELPVVGFNSAKYDLNVIKPYFFHRFVLGAASHQTKKEDGMQQTEDPPEQDTIKEEEEEDEEKKDKQNKGPSHHNPFGFVVKRNNESMCISTHKLRFLDISDFIAPGFSYGKYLAAYDIKEQKGFFFLMI